MNVAEYKAIQINKIIKESAEYKKYDKLKSSISQKYQTQELELKQLQQDIVNLAYYDEVEFDIKKQEYLEKKDEFYQDPLIKKFIEAYYSLQRMIFGVKKIIESGV